MALYSTCHEFIYNLEYFHGSHAILVVCHTMLYAFLSYAAHMFRLEIHAKATVWCALWACSISLLIHPKSGRPEGTRAGSVYMSVVLGYHGIHRI
jgi:hypothetical protein